MLCILQHLARGLVYSKLNKSYYDYSECHRDQESEAEGVVSSVSHRRGQDTSTPARVHAFEWESQPSPWLPAGRSAFCWRHCQACCQHTVLFHKACACKCPHLAQGLSHLISPIHRTQERPIRPASAAGLAWSGFSSRPAVGCIPC